MKTSLVTGKPQLNRRVNRALILDRIRTDGQISRAELAKVTSIRPPTVTAIIRDLLAEGLVIERGPGKPQGGRAPRMLELSCEAPQVLSFEITDSSILAGMADLRGQLRAKMSVPNAPKSPENTVDGLAELAEEVFARVRQEVGNPDYGWEQVSGVGIALPGLIDRAHQVVIHSQPLGWRNVDLRAECERRWGVTTDIVNDSMAGGMASHFFETPTVRNLVYFVLRFADATHGVVGIGTGLIIGGEPYHGEFGAAGEVTVPIVHPLVDARDAAGEPIGSTSDLVAALRSGVPAARSAMDRAAGELCLLISHAMNLFEPGRLVIESDVPELGQYVLERLRTSQARMMPHRDGDLPQTEVQVSDLGEFGGVRGAAVPALRRFFRLPSWS